MDPRTEVRRAIPPVSVKLGPRLLEKAFAWLQTVCPSGAGGTFPRQARIICLEMTRTQWIQVFRLHPELKDAL